MRRAPDMRSRGVRRSPVQRKGNGTFVPTGRETGAGSMRSAARGWGATGLGGQLGGKVSAFSIGRVPRVGGSGLTGAIRLINRTVFAPRMLAAAVREGRPTLRPFVVRLGTLATTGTLAGVLALAASGTAFAANPPGYGAAQPVVWKRHCSQHPRELCLGLRIRLQPGRPGWFGVRGPAAPELQQPEGSQPVPRRLLLAALTTRLAVV